MQPPTSTLKKKHTCSSFPEYVFIDWSLNTHNTQQQHRGLCNVIKSDEKNDWIRAFVLIRANMLWVLSRPTSDPSAEFHGNPFLSRFFAQTCRQRNRRGRGKIMFWNGTETWTYHQALQWASARAWDPRALRHLHGLLRRRQNTVVSVTFHSAGPRVKRATVCRL